MKAFRYYNLLRIKLVELKAGGDQEEKELLNRNSQMLTIIKQLKEEN